MKDRVRCEFALIRYVPDPVKGEFANIGVVLRAVDSNATMVRFTRDWSRVRCFDPVADTDMLESLEAELHKVFSSSDCSDRVSVGREKLILKVLAESLSNCVQITRMRGTLAESVPAEMEQLLRIYVEPLRTLVRARNLKGRQAILGQMRDAFTRVGVWDLMQKRVPASRYTHRGDSLRLDCGYRNGTVHLFHAVSPNSDVELAKSLAYSFGALREGVSREEAAELELTAIVEPVSAVPDQEHYSFALGVMEKAGLRVLTSTSLGKIAETARQELKV